MLGDLVGADTRTRELDHRPAAKGDPSPSSSAVRTVSWRRRRSSSANPTSGCMISTTALYRALLCGGGGTDDRPHLHLVDLREEEPEPAAARPEHRVRLLEGTDPPCHLRRLGLLERRQELVQRRIEEPDRHGQPGHGLEDALEVLLLEGEELRERRARSSSPEAMIIARTSGRRSSAMNMCSVRQSPIPWAPNSRALARPQGCRRLRAPSAGESRQPSPAGARSLR